MLTWTPFYVGHMVSLVRSTISSTILLSPIITAAATLYAPLSALLHGYRNTKIRRELCHMFSVNIGEDVATPLPNRKIFRSMSMRERQGLRRERQMHSFIGDINSNKDPSKQTCVESQTLLLALTSSSDSSARSSFSSGPSHPRYVTILANTREEATC